MKKPIVTYLLAVLSLLLCASCLKEEVPYLTISTEGDIEMESDGGAFTIEVKTNQSWTAVSDADWCVIEGGGDGSYKGEFVVKVSANTGSESRSANITITGGICTEAVTVIQACDDADFSVSASSISFLNTADTCRLSINSNYPWTAASSSGWCTLSDGAGDGDAIVEVTAKANDTGEERKATITFTVKTDGKSISRTVDVVQSEDSFWLKLPLTEFTAGKDEGRIEIPYLIQGQGIDVECHAGAEWITVESVADGSAILKLAENNTGSDRTADIAFNTKGQNREPAVCIAHVTQLCEESVLDILVTEVTLISTGEELRLPFITNGQVDIKSSSDWCMASVQGNDIVIMAEMNTQEDRTAYVTVMVTEDSGNVLARTIKVFQPVAAMKFEFENPVITLSYDASTGYAQLLSTGEWMLNNTTDSEIPAWLEVSPVSGTGDAMLTLKVMKNQFNRERRTQLSFSNTLMNKSISLEVIQQGNPNGIENYKYLGMGYDASGEYAVDSYVRNPVLDIDELMNKGYLADVININSTDERYIYGRTFEEYQKNLSVTAGISANYLGFSASVSTSFSSTSLSSQENEFSSFRHITEKQSYKILANLTAADLKECVIGRVQEDIDSMDPENLFLKYGTHVVTGFVLGGSLDYSMSADVSVMSSSIDWSIATSAGFRALAMGATASTEYSQYEQMTKEAANFESSLKARGGESQYASNNPNVTESTYNEWLASLSDPTKWVMVDYDGSQLIPIWDFASSSARKTELENAARSYLAKPAITVSSTHRKISMKLLKVGYLGDDNGGSAEVYGEMWYEIDNTGEKGLGSFGEIVIPDKSGEYPSHWNDFPGNISTTIEKISIHKDHTLKIRGEYGEADPGDDSYYNGSITLYYSASDMTWRIDSQTGPAIADGGTFILKAGSDGVRCQFSFGWK